MVGTSFGDADLDGRFNTGDLVRVFEAGQYEDLIPGNSGWAVGDWDGDAEFTSSDLLLAFQSGRYELNVPPAAAVPEPQSVWLLVIGVLFVFRWVAARC